MQNAHRTVRIFRLSPSGESLTLRTDFIQRSGATAHASRPISADAVQRDDEAAELDLMDTDFDVDEMLRLAGADPQGFVQRRQGLIGRLLRKSGQPQQFAQCQLELDAVRYCAGPGMPAAASFAELIVTNNANMQAQLATLHQLLDELIAKADVPAEHPSVR